MRQTLQRERWFGLALLLLLVFWGYATFQLPFMVAGLFFVGFIALNGLKDFRSSRITLERGLVLLFVFSLTLMLPTAIAKNPISPLHYLNGVVSVLAAYTLTNYRHQLERALLLTLSVTLFIIMYYLYTTDIASVPLEKMIEGASTNVITSYLVLLQAVYMAVLYSNRRKVPVITTLITFYICVQGFGRGSILAALLLVCACLGCYIFTIEKFVHRVAFLVISAACAIYVIVEYIPPLVSYLTTYTKLSAGLYDAARAEMWKDYLGKMNGISFLIGVGYENTSIDLKFNGNPHSSFIRSHNLFGIFYVFSVLLAPIFAIYKSRGFICKLYNTTILIVILFRSSVETMLFPTPMDLFFFIAIFCMMRKVDPEASKIEKTAS